MSLNKLTVISKIANEVSLGSKTRDDLLWKVQALFRLGAYCDVSLLIRVHFLLQFVVVIKYYYNRL